MMDQATKDKYISQKTRDLKEFGYSTLTRDQVADQLEKALKDEPTDVIGAFIKSDLKAARIIGKDA
jgi:hypothetical protein